MATFVLLMGVFHKPIRSIIELGVIKYYLWVIMLFILFSMPFLIKKKNIIPFDFYVVTYFVIVTVSFIINESQSVQSGGRTEIGLWVRYALLVSMYFVFAHLELTERYSFLVIFYFSVFLAIITITEAFFQNYYGITLFDYGGGYDIQGAGTKIHPWASHKFIRARGSAGYAQITGCLHAAFLLYFLHTFFNYKIYITSIYKRWPLRGRYYSKYLFDIFVYLLITAIALLVSLLALYLTGSGTGLLVFIIGLCCIIYFRYNISGALFLIMLSLLTLIGLFIALDYTTLEGYYWGAVYVCCQSIITHIQHISLDFFVNFLFGIGETKLLVQIFSSETHRFNTFVKIGLVPFISLILMLCNYLKIAWKLERGGRNNTLGFSLIVISLFIGSVHYECVFTFPANLLFFTAMGLTMRKYASNIKPQTN